MCLHRMADRLYGSLQRECDAHIGRQLAGLAAAQTADPTIFLQQVSIAAMPGCLMRELHACSRDAHWFDGEPACAGGTTAEGGGCLGRRCRRAGGTTASRC